MEDLPMFKELEVGMNAAKPRKAYQLLEKNFLAHTWSGHQGRTIGDKYTLQTPPKSAAEPQAYPMCGVEALASTPSEPVFSFCSSIVGLFFLFLPPSSCSKSEEISPTFLLSKSSSSFLLLNLL